MASEAKEEWIDDSEPVDLASLHPAERALIEAALDDADNGRWVRSLGHQGRHRCDARRGAGPTGSGARGDADEVRQVRWMTGARRELNRAFAFYETIDEGLADRIVARIEAKANWLGVFPTTGAPFAVGLRKSLVAGTPYLIIYRVRRAAVEILRVRHAAEDWR